MEKDITGKRFGRLIAVKKHSFVWDKNRHYGQNFWIFRCDCGNEKIINKTSVTRGLTTSCGCYHKEQDIKKHTTHNECKTRLYRCWQDMKNRCYNPTRQRYKNYGARGIKVCDEWLHSFENFSYWAKTNGYNDNLTIDRIDVNENYCPKNCRWITMKEQAKNKTNNHKITIKGVTKNLCDWLQEYNIKSSFYRYYRKKGLTDEEIFIRRK